MEAREKTTVVVKRIDIAGWKSPVAQQYGLRRIPHLELYDAQGRQVATGDPAREAFRKLE